MHNHQLNLAVVESILLPDSATICSCNNCLKADICSAIAEGSTSLGALKKCTKAATACGGCAPLVTQVLKSEVTTPRRDRE